MALAARQAAGLRVDDLHGNYGVLFLCGSLLLTNRGPREAAAHQEAAPDQDSKGHQAAQAALLRHVVGNPFAAPTPLSALSRTVHALAEAVYTGEDCAFALHDALLEEGQSTLAQHFGREEWHPKGCWALDRILHRR